MCHEGYSEVIITPTATWPPNQHSKSCGVGSPAEEPACLTQEAKSSEVGKNDDPPKKSHLELERPPTLVREDEDSGRNDDGKKQILEVITEIPEDTNTAIGNCRKVRGLLLFNW